LGSVGLLMKVVVRVGRYCQAMTHLDYCADDEAVCVTVQYIRPSQHRITLHQMLSIVSSTEDQPKGTRVL
jgi:hypothetical protein